MKLFLFIRETSKTLSDSFINFSTEDFTTVGNLSQSSKTNAKLLEAEQTRSYRRLLAQMNRADEIERQIGIEERWSAEDPRYLEALKYISNRTFIGAVERLEGLVVQRLFELSKANLAATGVCVFLIKYTSKAFNVNILRL